MEVGIGNYSSLFLLLLLPAAGFLLYRYKKWRAQKRVLFAEEKFARQLFPRERLFSKLLPLHYLMALLFLVLALLDISGGRQQMKVDQKTNSVIFLLDVSNSMNAQDVDPSRLELAKAIIINSVQKAKDGRIGVVLFAGEAESIMPLTTDYDAAETYLGNVETGFIGRQGTDFLKAVKVAAKKFKNIPKGARKIVLISDGEDNEGNEKAAIEEAEKEGIVINTVALGTEEGAPIPVYEFGQLMGYRTDGSGQTIITKKQPEALMAMANATQGRFIEGNNLDGAISGVVKVLEEKGKGSTQVEAKSSEHYYQWFLAVSLLFFLAIYFFNPKKDLNL